ALLLRARVEAVRERVVVVLAGQLRVGVALVLDLPRLGVAPAGVEGAEDRDPVAGDADRAADAARLAGFLRVRGDLGIERVRADRVRVLVVLVGGVRRLDWERPRRLRREAVALQHALRSLDLV